MGLVTAFVLSSMPVKAHPEADRLLQDKTLIRRLDARKKKEHKLSHRVRSLAKKAARREGRSKHGHPTRRPELTAPTDAGSLAFYRQRGHLAWPVDSRKVNMRFGLQTYMPEVKVNNLGISIATEKDAPVRAVYDGVVAEVTEIGNGVAVMVLHGKYYTIYSDLSDAVVTKGQTVSTGDVLGKMGDAGELDFRVYDEHGAWLDPEKWLAR